MVQLSDLRARLDPQNPGSGSIASSRSDESGNRAAVAAVLRERGALELLFIRRSEHPLDPWSGHMAFPGGRVDPEDRDELAAAVRETREELALDLALHGELLGELAAVQAVARGRRLPLVIQPYVFVLGEPELMLTPNHEVAEAVWVPLDFFLTPGNRQRMSYDRDGLQIELPCYRFAGREIWGLTLRMVDDIAARLGGEVGGWPAIANAAHRP